MKDDRTDTNQDPAKKPSSRWVVCCVAGGGLHGLEVAEMLAINLGKYQNGLPGETYAPIALATDLPDAMRKVSTYRRERKNRCEAFSPEAQPDG